VGEKAGGRLASSYQQAVTVLERVIRLGAIDLRYDNLPEAVEDLVEAIDVGLAAEMGTLRAHVAARKAALARLEEALHAA
jgi:hypothetical protein